MKNVNDNLIKGVDLIKTKLSFKLWAIKALNHLFSDNANFFWRSF